jgi:RecB family exonuclease
VITPRRTRLVRVPDLRALRQSIARLTSEAPRDLFRSAAVVVPTRGAGHQLALSLSNDANADIVTRDELYAGLNARLASPRRVLTSLEREVLLRSAAIDAIRSGTAPPFDLRPGLIAEMLRFYDQLRRQGQSVHRFEELIAERLGGDEDRGAVKLLEQTRFLAAAFEEYQRRLDAADSVDEHALREHLVATPAADPLRGVVVAVGDWIADVHGLAAADFDLLTRINGLERIDVIATERLLRSGFHQRVHDWLPGLEEVDAGALGIIPSPSPREFVAPVSRDRHEELVAVARRVKDADADVDRAAVVFERPLPYLYVAREVFGGAGLPYRTSDALPLAAEPVTAALDLVIEFASSQFTRDATLALLSSPHFTFEPARSNALGNLAALDTAMLDQRYLGELDRLRALDLDDNPSYAAAVTAAEELRPLLDNGPASHHLHALVAFLTSHANDVKDARALRGRSALLDILQGLASAYEMHGDRHATIDDLAPEIRRWIEDATFAPESGDHGLHLLDAQAARFGDFENITLVGLIEGEWPERSKRNIFYAPSVLGALGWPSERDRRSAATAAFLDLVTSASRHVTVSTFTLDDEALVEPSALLDDVAALGLTRIEWTPPAKRVFVDEALSLDPVDFERLDPNERVWAEMRVNRTDAHDSRYHGAAGPQPSAPISVSAVESYLTCPFKYFARYVLRLEEERDEEEVMDPKTQGQFVHAVFEAFFTAWQDSGRRNITPDNLDDARALFAEVVEEKVRPLPEAEAALERTRLLGSPVAAGLGEVVFRMEAERPTPVRERLLEYRLKGDFEFIACGETRRVALKGVADRLDLLEDGTLRLVDYKLSSAPSKSRALQLPIYGLCAEQRLKAYKGRDWTLGEAAYIAFRGAKRVTPLFTARTDRAQVLADAQDRLVDAVDRIARGEFPPTPEDVFLCDFCSYGAVCRKDYVGDV